jgi:hypothetical protein
MEIKILKMCSSGSKKIVKNVYLFPEMYPKSLHMDSPHVLRGSDTRDRMVLFQNCKKCRILEKRRSFERGRTKTIGFLPVYNCKRFFTDCRGNYQTEIERFQFLNRKMHEYQKNSGMH